MLPVLAAPLLPAALSWVEPSALQPGQRGTCVTEWTGGERLTIPIEVVGVLDATAPERSAVLVRLLDPRFEGSGVVALFYTFLAVFIVRAACYYREPSGEPTAAAKKQIKQMAHDNAQPIA